MPFATPNQIPKSKQNSMAAIVGAASNSDTGNACKRLQKELMALMMNSDDGISAFPDSDNMLNWCAPHHPCKNSAAFR